MDTLVSVITPSYNQAAFLEETILSVLNQSYPNIEYIIIDGGSNDGSIEIIKKYEDKISYWISEKDNGQADAINKGFLKAKGEYICWLNSDDLFYPDFIKTRLQQFSGNPGVDLIYGDVEQGTDLKSVWIRKGEQTSFNSMLKTLNVPIPQQSTMWRRGVLGNTGFLDTQLHVLLDRDYFIRISKNHKIFYSPGALAFFRVHQDSKSVNEALKWADELPAYYISLTEKYEEYRRHRHSVMAKCYWYCSKIYAEANNTLKAREFLEKAKRESVLTITRFVLFEFMLRLKHKIL